MQWNILFFFNSVLLGVGLAMDAFSVSLANGLNEPHMSRRRMLGIAGVFAAFQALMPMTGWVCVHTIVQYFRAFEKLIPWIALALLGFIGGKMLIEGPVWHRRLWRQCALLRKDSCRHPEGAGRQQHRHWQLYVSGQNAGVRPAAVRGHEGKAFAHPQSGCPDRKLR